MPHFLIDNFDNPGLWNALDPGDNPSVEITLSGDNQTHPFAVDDDSIRMQVQSNASGHLIRRTIPETDLTNFNDLTLWLHSDIAASGMASDPLRLRLSLGSAGLPIGAVGNDWVRYLTVDRADSWSYAVLALDDLPNAVRSALITIEIQVIATDDAHTIYFDALEANTPSMVLDVDSALLAQLDAQLLIGGVPVAAAIEPAAPPVANQPAIRIIQYEAMHNEMRGESGSRHTDFTETDFRVRNGSIPWDIFYHINFISDNRADQAIMVDFVINQLGHRSWLPVGNRSLRIEQVEQVKPDDALIDAPIFRYRVAAWSETIGETTTVLPVNEVTINTDLATPANGGV